MKRYAFLPIILIAAISWPAQTQAQDRLWTVITASYDTLSSCSLGLLDNGTLRLVCGSSSSRIPVDSVRSLTRPGTSHFWTGAGYGTLGGAVLGGIIGGATYEKPNSTSGFTLDFGPGFNIVGGAIAGAVGGFLVGGVIGATSGGDEVHDIMLETHAAKVRILTDLAGEKN